MPLPLVVIAAALGVVLAGCVAAPGGEDGDAPRSDTPRSLATDDAAATPLRVVATTSILGDIMASLAGDDAEVTTLMPPGVDPHGYEPSARDGQALREADLVVSNGLGLEESLVDVLDRVEDEGVRVFSLAETVDPIPYAFADMDSHGAHEEDAHDGDGHGHENDEDAHDGDHSGDEAPRDPHVWFDLVRMADGVRSLADEIAAVDDTLDDPEWTQRGDVYSDELLDLHDEIQAVLAQVPDEDRRIVTNHESLGYLAERYGFDVVATVIPGTNPNAQTSAAALAELVEVVEAAEVEVVFAENTDATVLVEQLRSELGRSDIELDVVRIYTDALGEDGSGADTYPGLLRTTAQRIAEALSAP